MISQRKLSPVISVLSSFTAVAASIATLRVYKLYLDSSSFGLFAFASLIVGVISLFDLGLATYSLSQRLQPGISPPTFRLLLSIYQKITLFAGLLICFLFMLFRYPESINTFLYIAAYAVALTWSTYLASLCISPFEQLYGSGLQIGYCISSILIAFLAYRFHFPVSLVLVSLAITTFIRVVLLSTVLKLPGFALFLPVIPSKALKLIRLSFSTYRMNIACAIGFHLDRYLVIALLPAQDIGTYFLALQFSAAFGVFSFGITSYFLSRLKVSIDPLSSLVARSVRLVSFLLLSSFVLFLYNSSLFFRLWLPSHSYPPNLPLMSSLMVLGFVLNSYTIPFYYTLLSFNSHDILAKIYVIVLIVMVPLTSSMVFLFSTLGAVCSYILYNLLYLVLIVTLSSGAANIDLRFSPIPSHSLALGALFTLSYYYISLGGNPFVSLFVDILFFAIMSLMFLVSENYVSKNGLLRFIGS